MQRGPAYAWSALAALVLALWTPSWAAADTLAFTISDERIVESSGLARDVERDRYWTVNDSGDRGRAFAVDSQGRVRASVSFLAEPVDVEAVAVSEDRVYVADIGDNGQVRDSVTVYSFLAPGDGRRLVGYRAYVFRYPDGAHDAETLLMDRRGQMFVVTKGAKAGIYSAPSEPSRAQVNRLTRVGSAPALVTDGTVLPDGRIVLRTHTSLEVLDPKTYATVSSTPIPEQPQGESVALSLSGDRLLVGSEGANSRVLAVEIPKRASPSARPSSSPTAGDPVPDPSTRDRGPWSTTLTVASAAAAALLAGAVVALRRG